MKFYAEIKLDKIRAAGWSIGETFAIIAHEGGQHVLDAAKGKTRPVVRHADKHFATSRFQRWTINHDR